MVAALLVSVAIAVSRPAAPSAAHPLHTTMAEVTVDRARSTVRVVVRVFADDFATAVEWSKTTGPFETRAAAYVGGAISFVDEKRRHVPARDCGTRKQGDLLWLCAEATVSAEQLRHVALRDQMLCELFADQVNVVRVTDGTATRSMLFTRGDAERPIL